MRIAPGSDAPGCKFESQHGDHISASSIAFDRMTDVQVASDDFRLYELIFLIVRDIVVRTMGERLSTREFPSGKLASCPIYAHVSPG